MKIENDKVTFDTADFAGLSDHAKKAVTVYLEDYAAYFSAKVNKEIELAKAHLKTLTVSEPLTDSILMGLAAADDAKLLQAEPLLNQLDAILNPVVAPSPDEPAVVAEESPVVVAEESPSLLQRFANLFR